MKTLSKKQFLDYLIASDACGPALDWARAWPEEGDFRAQFEAGVAQCEHTDWLAWLAVRLGGPARAEYERVTGPARAEYERVQGPAWAEYWRIEGPAWAEYERVRGPAWAEYERIRDQAAAEHWRVQGLAARQALTWERVVEAVTKFHAQNKEKTS